MPLKPGYVGNLNEDPLAGDVLEARFDNPQLHGTCKNEPGQYQQRARNGPTYRWGVRGPLKGGWLSLP